MRPITWPLAAGREAVQHVHERPASWNAMITWATVTASKKSSGQAMSEALPSSTGTVGGKTRAKTCRRFQVH